MLKQSDVIEQLDVAIEKAGIHVIVDDRRLLGSLKGQAVALDVEHDESGGFVAIGLSRGNDRNVFVFTDYALVHNLSFDGVGIIGHNVITDIECMQTWGINVSYEQCVWDTMLIGHILDSSKRDFSLKAMAARELGVEYPSYDEIVGEHKRKTKKSPACPRIRTDCCGRITLDKQPIELVAKYNALDVYCTYKLAQKQELDEILRVL